MIDFKVDLQNLQTASDQSKFFEEIFENPFALKFPPAVRYKKKFLKRLIDEWEAKNVEVDERFYRLYCEISSTSIDDNDEDRGHRIFLLKNGSTVVVKESSLVIGYGTTGFQLWLAGFLLAEWILEHPEYLEGKNCLELGSGLGLAGLVAIQAAKPKSYTFSDHHPKVLDLLRYNIRATLGQNFSTNSADENFSKNLADENFSKNSADENFSSNSTAVNAIQLDWNDFDAAAAAALPELPDLVLGSDISFQVEDQPKIVGLLKRIFERNFSAKAFVCFTIRSDSAPLRLRECLEAEKFQFLVHKLRSRPPEEQIICIAANEQGSVELLEIFK